MVCLVQRAGKRFSSSLALGTDVVADITDRLPSDMPCYHDRARYHRSYFNPHGGPITHSSTGSKPNSLVHLCFPKLFLALDFVCKPRATFLAIYSGITRNTYSHCFEPLSPSVSGNERLPNWLKLLIAPFYLALDDFLEFQLERCLFATFTEVVPR